MARIAARYKTILSTISRLLVFSMVLKAAVDVSDRLSERAEPLALGSISAAAVLCTAAHLAALTVGFWSSRLWNIDRPGQIAVAFACSQKTLPVALYLFDLYFKEQYPLAVVPLVFYHAGQLILDTVIADVLSKTA